MEVWSAAGRRKSAVAQVRICSPGTGAITVNQVDAEKYLQGAFPTILKPFETVKLEPTFDLYIRSQGGGLSGQADAISLGCAKALCLMNPEGLLKRNALKKERKKYGLKKARKAPQFSKR
jgi:small subunit ribosomal protein S9